MPAPPPLNPSGPPAGPPRPDRWRLAGPPAALLLALTTAWELLVRGRAVPDFILPAPTQVAVAFVDHGRAMLLVHLPVTALEVLLGFLLALAAGVAVAVAMHLSPPVQRALYPLVVASQTIPIIAFSPVFLLWFGYSLAQKVAVTVLITFFALAVNVYDGLRSADPNLVDLFRSAGASRWQVFRQVEAPAALPLFFSGARVAAAVSVVGATIGEWLGGSAGLGYFGRRMAANIQAPALFASVILLSLLGIGLFLLVVWLERRLIPWYQRRHTGSADG